MKNKLSSKTFLAFLAVVVLLSCNSKDSHTHNADVYTCPMHPTVVSDRPATCPVCGMDLVRKARPGEEVKITEELASLIKSSDEQIASSIQTTKPEYTSFPVSIESEGTIVYDTKSVLSIPSRISGRLEKVYVKYYFQQVSKGQKVADIYSPELLTAQSELLYLVKKDSLNKDMILKARQKLLYMGVAENQLNEIMQTRREVRTFSVYSPASGYVINLTANKQDQNNKPETRQQSDVMESPEMKISNENSEQQNPEGLAEIVREGGYVSAGQPLFTLTDDRALRLEFNLPAELTAGMKKGDAIKVTTSETKSQEMRIDLIQPYQDRDEKFVKLRVYTNNKELMIGQLNHASIQIHTNESLWLPATAAVDLGMTKVVFVKERKIFKAVKVETGVRSNTMVQILSGLTSSSEVAVNGQYLVDSEGFIKSK